MPAFNINNENVQLIIQLLRENGYLGVASEIDEQREQQLFVVSSLSRKEIIEKLMESSDDMFPGLWNEDTINNELTDAECKRIAKEFNDMEDMCYGENEDALEAAKYEFWNSQFSNIALK